MEGHRLFKSIDLRNVLSYGPRGGPFELEPLNVLIGANGSGKSNLVEAIGVLASAPKDVLLPIRQGGGVRNWIWKGNERERKFADLAVVLDKGFFFVRPDPGGLNSAPVSAPPLRYRMMFSSEGPDETFQLETEELSGDSPEHFVPDDDPTLVYRYRRVIDTVLFRGVSTDFTKKPPEVTRPQRHLRRDSVSSTQSILSQRRDPDQYPELTAMADVLGQIRFYRDYSLGRDAAPRRPQPADLRNDFLSEDAANLALVLNQLRSRPADKRRINERLREFNDRIVDFDVAVQGGTVQLFLDEGFGAGIPATRVSDGTLRYLCLLSILCHPSPPPLICIEEPELGLHPDIIPKVAELLVEASGRTQIIVTTHSDTLVDALSHVPESIVVCERGDDGTTLRRLEPERMKAWLEQYRLGQLWSMGEIGGNRW